MAPVVKGLKGHSHDVTVRKFLHMRIINLEFDGVVFGLQRIHVFLTTPTNVRTHVSLQKHCDRGCLTSNDAMSHELSYAHKKLYGGFNTRH